MWPRWSKISGEAAPRPPAHALQFSYSFKDIPSLVEEDDKDSSAAAAAAVTETSSSPSNPNPNPNPNPNSKSGRKSSIFHRVRIASAALRSWKSIPSAAEKRIVVYHTSLRVVRKTFEDCRAVRSILLGFRVAIDERDLSMDSSFLAELKGILGKKQLSLPRVFIGGRYIGGAEEVQQLHECGELKKFIEGFPLAAGAESGLAGGVGCQSCGGVRFLLCGSCNGSHKYYHQEKGAFRACNVCNENGLVRCPDCG